MPSAGATFPQNPMAPASDAAPCPMPTRNAPVLYLLLYITPFIGHALGMYHEQVRSDRDKYINIIWNNIKEERKPQFIRYACADNFLVNDLVTRFDFKSIMLYASFSTTAINQSLPVMTDKSGGIWRDNVYNGTHAPSATDANWVKIRYKIVL